MKSITCLFATLLAVQAAPLTENVVLLERQLGGADTRNDLQNGNAANCPKAIFIFARASGEDGNMVCTYDCSGSTHKCSSIDRVVAQALV